MNNKKKKDISLILAIVIPLLIGVVLATVSVFNDYLKNNLNVILMDAVTLLVTLFGFILASLSILVSFEGNEKTKQIRESRHYKRILGVHLVSDIWMFLGVCCLFAFKIFGVLNGIAVWIFVLVVSVSFFYLALVLFYLAVMIGTLFVEKKKYY